jgi:hypothetical protein
MFFKTDYKQEIIESLEKADYEKINDLAAKAFKDKNASEDLLAWVAAIIFEKQIWSSVNLLSEFVQKFPASLHGIRVYFSDILSRQKRFDEASDEARCYLRIVFDYGFDKLKENKIIRESTSKAFLLLTSSFTELGARSYSKRVLDNASSFASDYWRNIYSQEIKTLDNELNDASNKNIDNKWEEFFNSGGNADFLFKWCEEKGFPRVAKRVDLLEGNFRFNKDFKLTDSEALQLVYENNNQFILV